MSDDDSASDERNVLTYKSAGLKTSLHGDIFQLNLLMLFLYRATKLYEQFHLATEINDAAAFDDVVLKYKKFGEVSRWAWRFLQAKHALNPEKQTVTADHLFHLDTKGKPMCLHKYLNSFCYIKEQDLFRDADLESFILCSNFQISPKAEPYLIADGDLSNDKILQFRRYCCNKYKLNPTARDKLSEVYEKKYKKQVKQEYLDEFLEKFRLVFNYPNKDQLNRLIEVEMGRRFRLLNAELVTSSFKNNMLEWFASYKDGNSNFLWIEDGKGFLETINSHIKTLMITGLSTSYPEALNNLGVSFTNIPPALIDFLLSNTQQVLFIVSKSTLLSSVKVLQQLQHQRRYTMKDSVIFLSLKQLMVENIQNLAYDCFNSSKSHYLFVIECKNKTKIDSNLLDQLCCNLLDVLCDIDNKKLIIISNDSHEALAKDIMNSNSGITYKEVEDTVAYEDLDEVTQCNLLRKKIMFQGNLVGLEEILDTKLAKVVLDAVTIESLLLQTDIHVDDVRRSVGDPSADEYFVKRTLRHQCFKWDVLRTNFPHSNLLLLTGTTKKYLLEQNCSRNVVFEWDSTKIFNNGIVILPQDANKLEVLQTLCANTSTNIYCLEYDDKFRLENFRTNCDFSDCIDDEPFNNQIKESFFSSSKLFDRKVNILAEDPGFGKSWFLTCLARNIKKNHPNTWVIKINLNDHGYNTKMILSYNIIYKSLEHITFSEDDTEEAIRFLVDMAFPMQANTENENRFQKNFLYHTLKASNGTRYPKTVLLFDGFDEISPTYKKNTLTLLKGLYNSNATQLWITSRVHEKSSLELYLQTPAYRLNPFTENDKKEYLKRAWQTEHTKPSSMNMEYHLYSQVKGGLKSDFINVPLQLKMWAEVSMLNNNQLSRNFGLVELYNAFIENKFKIYFELKKVEGVSVGAEESRARDSVLLKKKHQLAAFLLLFPSHTSSEDREKIQKNTGELVRVGLLVGSGPNIKYIHRSFAEYFIADYIGRKIAKAPIRSILFHNIFFGGDYKYVLKFLDKKEDLLPNLKKYASENVQQLILDKENIKPFFYELLKEDNNNILKYFCGILFFKE